MSHDLGIGISHLRIEVFADTDEEFVVGGPA